METPRNLGSHGPERPGAHGSPLRHRCIEPSARGALSKNRGAIPSNFRSVETVKLLITNSVPLNGGDEALLMAVIEALRQKWPSSSATVLCRNLELCREHLPGLALASDLEFAASREEWEEGVASYRGADVVISAPGGFLHDYYGIQDRLSGLE